MSTTEALLFIRDHADPVTFFLFVSKCKGLIGL